MRILVTGGAGFIGSHLCEALLKESHQITCLDNFDDFYDPSIKQLNIQNCLHYSTFELVKIDILDSAALEHLFSLKSFDMVIHLAAKAGVRPSIANPQIYQKVNIEGTTNLLEAMRKHSIKKLILASSSSVYGNNKKIPYSETDNVDNAISPYAATKKACEILAYTYHHLFQIETFCLRFFTVYGPRQRPEMAIHYFTRNIDKGEPINVFGDGKTYRDYTYIDDIIQGILGCVYNLRGYEIINLGESETTSLIDLVSFIELAIEKKAKINWLPMQAGDVEKTFADIRKAESLISYSPGTSIKIGIQNFIEWYKQRNANW